MFKPNIINCTSLSGDEVKALSRDQLNIFKEALILANNKSIQFLRKNGAPTTTELGNLLPGQPLFDSTHEKLYVGKIGGGGNN